MLRDGHFFSFPRFRLAFADRALTGSRPIRIALWREHIQRAVPALVNNKAELAKAGEQLHGADINVMRGLQASAMELQRSVDLSAADPTTSRRGRGAAAECGALQRTSVPPTRP